jgi:O-antigen ligase
MLPIFFLFRRYKLDWRLISIGISVGVFITVGLAIYEVYFLGFVRAAGGMNHVITFGELMVAADMLLWVLMIYAWNNNNKLLATVLLIASLVAFYGSLLSVTRGAWLVYIFLILSFVIYTLKRSITSISYFINMPMLLRIFLACIVFFLVAQTEQYNQIKTRTTDTFIKASQGEYEDASGKRISIFRTALEVSRHFPLGVGTDNFRSGATAVIILDAINNENIVVKNKRNVVLDNYNLKGDIHNYRLLSFNEDGTKRYSSIYRHAHNEWLNILAENGVAGIILLTLLFAFPIKIFWQNLSHENDLVAMYSYCGILFIVSFAIFGQTQSIFSSHGVVIFFIFFLFLFIAQISRLMR